MKIILSLSLILLVFHGSRAEEELFQTCPELKGSKFETFANWFSSKSPYKGSKFFIALKNETKNDGLLEINSGNMSSLTDGVFNVSLKTYVITHGFRSHGQKPWVLEMKQKILQNENVNVIIVDWREGSYSWNYIDSVRTTTSVSRDLFELFLNLKAKLPRSDNVPTLWNHLYFIGHSLGAHISGQTGYLLRTQDDFFKVDRITGLDPAWPCFSKAPPGIRLDKQNADFVDIIHTQTNQGDKVFGLGLKEPIGHVDFYVNGGVIQPACKSESVWKNELDDMFCSHRMAYQYFMEFMNTAKSCQLLGRRWDQSHPNAVQILDDVKNNKPCNDCIELGQDHSNHVERFGTYLVLASSKAPYCSLKNDDYQAIREKLNLVVPPKTENKLWNLLFGNGKSRKS